MRYLLTLVSLVGCCCLLVLHPSAKGEAADNRNLLVEADQCANILYQFGVVKKDFFPKGPEKAVQKSSLGKDWPPPQSYSWRVLVLPMMEQVAVYEKIVKASKRFLIPGTISNGQLRRLPSLTEALHEMPEWLTLDRYRQKEEKAIYRRIIIPDEPEKLIIVESATLVPWYRPGDELILTDDIPIPKEVGGNFPSGFFALCGDGKVRFISQRLPEKSRRRALLSGAGLPAIRAESKKERREDM